MSKLDYLKKYGYDADEYIDDDEWYDLIDAKILKRETEEYLEQLREEESYD